MKALLFNNGLRVDEIPIPPASPDEVLGKVLIASFTPIDRAVITGIIPSNSAIPGSTGLIRVIEPPIPRKNDIMEGEVFFVRPRCSDIIYGYNFDGFLAEYSRAHTKCLIKIPKSVKLSTELLLNLEFSYVEDILLNIPSNKVLVLGCCIEAYVVSKTLFNKGFEVVVACNNSKLRRYIASEGINVVKYSNINGRYDSVIVFDHVLGVDSTRYVKSDGLLIIPPTQPPHYIRVTDNLHIYIPKQRLPHTNYLGGIPKNLVNESIAVTNSLDRVPALIKYFERVIYTKI